MAKLLENCDVYAVDYYFAMKRKEVLEYNIYLSLDTFEKHEKRRDKGLIVWHIR